MRAKKCFRPSRCPKQVACATVVVKGPDLTAGWHGWQPAGGYNITPLDYLALAVPDLGRGAKAILTNVTDPKGVGARNRAAQCADAYCTLWVRQISLQALRCL
jgi:hypothetical protein